jgi:putative PIN family toxin of toxin-antitoxin system
VRIVLDTNVLVSGLLSPFGPPGEIVRMISSGELTLCLDARILAEYREVLLRPKFGVHVDAVAALLHFVEYRGHTVASSPLPEHLADLSDEAFLEVALACGAERLVTGNLAHFPTQLRQGVAVFSPGEFMSAYRMR